MRWKHFTIHCVFTLEARMMCDSKKQREKEQEGESLQNRETDKSETEYETATLRRSACSSVFQYAW